MAASSHSAKRHMQPAFSLDQDCQILKWLQGKLPYDFFEKDNIWLHRGNMYRLMLEPADIANHYGSSVFAGMGHYLEGNRAGR